MAVQIRQPDLAPNSAVVSASGRRKKAAAERFQTPDRLFELLDGRTVTAGGQLWKVEVFGIRDLAGHRWIQVGLSHEETNRMATVRIAAGGSLELALSALASWAGTVTTDEDSLLNIA